MMDSEDFVASLLAASSVDDLDKLLGGFNQQNANEFSFANFSLEARKSLGDLLAKKLLDTDFSSAYVNILEFLRIVARDKNNLEALINEDILRMLSIRARLTKEQQGDFPDGYELKVTTEAQKVLCNLIFHSPSAQRYFSREDIVDVMMLRISSNKNCSKWPLENQTLDMKLLFLITILCADTRAHLRNDLHAVQDLCVTATQLADSSLSKEPPCNGLICEILKVLFNLVCNMSTEKLTLGEEMDFTSLGNTCRELLIADSSEDIKKHAINLLTVVKKYGYNQLILPLSEEDQSHVSNKSLRFHGWDLQAVKFMLTFLDDKLSSTDRTSTGNKNAGNNESLAPVLCALSEASKNVPVIRRYLKLQILPPLTDVHTRPEVGTTLRNKMCRLLTSTNTTVRDSAGDFLYILCKNNVQRLIKYMGYGNAAGWLAERGLMGLPKTEDDKLEDTDPSDTEEFQEHRDKIDWMTGHIPKDRPNPMTDWTEEQKEAAALELVNALDKMAKSGLGPAVIGADGKPHQIRDVLEFREKLSHENGNKKQHDPDNDSHSNDEEE